MLLCCQGLKSNWSFVDIEEGGLSAGILLCTLPICVEDIGFSKVYGFVHYCHEIENWHLDHERSVPWKIQRPTILRKLPVVTSQTNCHSCTVNQLIQTTTKTYGHSYLFEGNVLMASARLPNTEEYYSIYRSFLLFSSTFYNFKTYTHTHKKTKRKRRLGSKQRRRNLALIISGYIIPSENQQESELGPAFVIH